MAISDELQEFVKDGLMRGASRAEIEQVLREAGWPADQVRGALAGFAEIEFPIPVPRPRPYMSAREAFLLLVLFSALYIGAFNLGSLVFQLINLALPNPDAPANAADLAWDVIRWAVSFLVVTVPVFVYVFRLTSREIRRDPSKRASKIRRWLTYLTLFIAAAVLTGDVTSLIYNFLGGETTVRFVLKVVTIGAIAGAIFRYYLRDLRREEREVGA